MTRLLRQQRASGPARADDALIVISADVHPTIPIARAIVLSWTKHMFGIFEHDAVKRKVVYFLYQFDPTGFSYPTPFQIGGPVLESYCHWTQDFRLSYFANSRFALQQEHIFWLTLTLQRFKPTTTARAHTSLSVQFTS
jgi:hypothetical protein